MGNQVSTVPTQLYSVEDYFSDLPEYEFVEKMGSTRFLKIARAKYRGGYVVVKVFPRIDKFLLQTYQDKVRAINEALTGCPGTLAFPKAVITDRSGILIRQYVWCNLYDRINLRPFLSQIEKLWIVYQMLRSLDQCHSKNVCHGDLKTENFLLTSWNWVLLTDFACYKPTELLEDNPAGYSFFFDTTRRRNCYIAPERFKLVLAEASPPLKPSMDIFSLGCVIAELYLEGAQLFNLHQLISYRNGDFFPDKSMECIDNKEVAELIKSMIAVAPTDRLSAAGYLEQFSHLFPSYFPFLYQFVKVFCSSIFNSSDKKVLFLYHNLNLLISNLKQADGKLGHIVILSVVTSCIRGIQKQASKVQALEILELLSNLTPDEIVVDRIVPHILYFSTDPSAKIRANCVVSLSRCLKNVTSLPTTDVNIFPEYIFPIINKLATDEEKLVQRVFAERIGPLAEYALNFLEMNPPTNFDAELQALHNIVQIPVVQILTGDDNIARRILLEKCITSLCVFFGQQKANDLILSHMITFLNYKNDWRLRAAFFDCVVGVAAFVGWHSLNMLKPLLQQGLTDVEEFVVSKTLSALVSLAQLGLLEEKLMNELVVETAPLLCHPNLWIRYRTVGFISSACSQLHIADVYCKILPTLHHILALPVRNPDNGRALLQALAAPLPRPVLDFLVLNSANEKVIAYLSKHSNSSNKIPDDIKPIIEKLGNLGMDKVHEKQVLILKDYIMKVHIGKKSSHEDAQFEDIVNGAIVVEDEEVKTHDFMEALVSSPTSMLKSPVSTKPSRSPPQKTKASEIKMSSSTELTDSDLAVDLASDPMFRSIEGDIDVKPLTDNKKFDQLQGLLSRKQAEYLHHVRTERPSNIPADTWLPKGILVCHIQEHKAAINKVKVSPKHSILATSSDDGCVKIWNARKIDSRNIINNSRHTYSRQNQPIKGMAFYDTGDKVAAITRNGSLHEVGVKELKVCAARTIAMAEEDVVVDMDTLGSGQEQTLVICTCDGKIIGIDVRSPSAIFKLSNKPRMGCISAMCVDRNEHWICLGTRNGWMTCWDLRFRLPITSWRHETEGAILCLKPSLLSMSSLCVGLENYTEVGIWNIESSSREKVLWYGPHEPFQTTQSEAGVHAMLPLGPDTIVTGSSDNCVRYWNTVREANSFTLSGPPDLLNNHIYKKKIVKNVEVIQAEENTGLLAQDDTAVSSSKGVAQPSPAHHHTVSDIAFTKTTQPFIVTVDKGGVMKIWK